MQDKGTAGAATALTTIPTSQERDVTQAPPSVARFQLAGIKAAELNTLLADVLQAHQQRSDLATLRQVSNSELKARLDAVRDLCTKGRFADALPGARELALLKPQDWRHVFVLASCLQRLKKPEQALPLYTAVLMMKAVPTAAVRSAECLAALGQPETATRVLSRVASENAADKAIQTHVTATAASLQLSLKPH